MTVRYTEEEIELLREQLRRGNKEAMEAAKKLGIKLHPRVAAIRAALGERVPRDQEG